MISVGIDTSNYTTSYAVCEDGIIVENIKLPLPVKEGSHGLRQSDAVFAHIKNTPALSDMIKSAVPDIISYSSRPRPLEGSYMPCFRVGESLARFASAQYGIKYKSFSNQEGHLRAALYSSGREDLTGGEYLAIHLSGGTTELLHVHNGKIEIIGGTLDLTAGQAIDRIAAKLSCGFPGGPELEKIAKPYKVKPAVSVKDTYCNISGLENTAAKMQEELRPDSETAYYTLEFIKLSIAGILSNALKKYPGLDVICAGGVMSNNIIRSYLEDNFPCFFAKPEFSSDNAAGIALLGYDYIKAK